MTSKQTFWCFLATPQPLQDSNVYANSSAYITVASNAEGNNSFGIPVQYIFAAGASNKPVGLGVFIDSHIDKKVSIGDQWQGSFFDAKDHQGPSLLPTGDRAPSNTIQLLTNNYDQAQEAVHEWYASNTFGVESDAGFIGLTWAPQAGKTTTLTPKLEFYIATGDYERNTLADLSIISTKSQSISLTDFDKAFDCTVTLDSSGIWSVASGKPLA